MRGPLSRLGYADEQISEGIVEMLYGNIRAMDQSEEKRRWETSQELYQAADAAFHQQHYRACAGLAYYACFQAMWCALGDPPLGV